MVLYLLGLRSYFMHTYNHVLKHAYTTFEQLDCEHPKSSSGQPSLSVSSPQNPSLPIKGEVHYITHDKYKICNNMYVHVYNTIHLTGCLITITRSYAWSNTDGSYWLIT